MILTRTITALVMAIVLGVVLFKAETLGWIGFILLGTFWAAWEWVGFTSLKSKVVRFFLAFIFSVLIYFSYLYLNDFLIFVLVPFSILMMVFSVFLFQRRKGGHIVRSDSVILLFGLIALVPFFISLMLFREIFSPTLLLLCFFVIWAVDVGAFFSGKRFGKHKLAVYVSPGKTWEGVFGGVVLAFIVSYIGLFLLKPYMTFTIWQAALLLSLIGALSVYGDLFESVLKRQANIKDSGALLPGHGGLLDRVDSLMMVMPVFYLFWLWVS